MLTVSRTVDHHVAILDRHHLIISQMKQCKHTSGLDLEVYTLQAYMSSKKTMNCLLLNFKNVI